MNREPIAIIGIGCRFPGAKNPQAFWQLLCDGVDAITKVPPERWDVESFYSPDPMAPDKMNTQWGGFLEDVDQFDPQFFGIAPREAASIDPQQRLLLEVSWEALEDAGIIPERLAGTRTGVFIGISSFDYYELLIKNPTNIDAYGGTGNTNCIAANRISYAFDLQGPSLAIDTACSSSLVAVHLACQSLWSGESTLALAGGVHVMLSPWVTVSFAKAGFMAPDGRCKTFDAGANGYVRSEGVGVVVLKPLSQALQDNDPIYTVIRGSAVNQDGRSNGLTAPNPWAQEAVIREACRQAEVSPSFVQYVEVHGTGTTLGDAMEMKALGAVLAKDRPPGDYCFVGSVKTNIGHAEAAAGIAGLIKVALSLRHRQIPPSLHFQKPNPYIHFEKLTLRVQQTLTPWPEAAYPALAGVSSFGFGGTNAHLVLEAPPKTRESFAALNRRPLHLLTLSAKSDRALLELAQRYVEFLSAQPSASLADICFTANTLRTHFNHRLAIAAASTVQLQKALSDFTKRKQIAQLTSGQVQSRKRPQIAFVFTDQVQHIAIGRQLYDTIPTFRQTIDRCNEILLSYLDIPLLETLYPQGENAQSKIQNPKSQSDETALFAIEYALVELWKSWGITPDVLIGHGVGEYVAACVAKVFSLEDGLKLTVLRARLLPSLPQNGETLAFEQIADVRFSSPQIDLIDNTTGLLVTTQIATPEYWLNHLRQPVKQADGTNLYQQGYKIVEIGPTSTERNCLPSLHPEHQHWQQILQILAQLYVHGVSVNWSRFDRDYPRHRVVLPTYPFQRQRYWFKTTEKSDRQTEFPDAQSPLVNLLNQGDTKQLAQELEKAGNFSEEQLKLLPELLEVIVRQHQQHLPNDVVFDYYNSLSKTSNALNYGPDKFPERYLTFAPFPEVVPGFSWILTQAAPQKHQEYVQIALNAQREMRDVLFTNVDFSSITSVLDFGCGYGSDLITLAEKYQHLRLCGYTISSEQAKIATNKVRDRKLQERLEVFNRDSSKDEFPNEYDLVFGFEVAHHIKNKQALFSNVGRHLKDSGFLVLADFISNAAFPIEHSETSSYFITKEEWALQLSQNHLKVIDCLEVSQEIANFLHDPNFQEHLNSINQIDRDDNIKAAFQSYNKLGLMLRNNLASYVLLTAQKQNHLSKDEIYHWNQGNLSALVPYSERGLKQSLYQIKWQPKALSGEPSLDQNSGIWLIFADRGGVGQALAELLEGRGDRCVLVFPGETYEIIEAGRRIDYRNPQHFQHLFQDVLSGGAQCRGVVHLWSLDTPTELTISLLKSDPLQICGSVLHLVQAATESAPRLWLITRGAVPIDTAPLQVQQAPLWGLGRAIALEHPEMQCVRIDLELLGNTMEIPALFAELTSEDKEDQVAFRQGIRYVARLVQRTTLALPPQSPLNLLRADNSYLITGGLGALGLMVARWMVEQGARHLVLIGRSSPTEAAKSAISQLEIAGAQILVLKADVSNQKDIIRVLKSVSTSLPPLRGIIHAAGILNDGRLIEQNWESFSRVMAPKVEGTWNLHILTIDMPLDFFVCFSSIASLLGSPGQGNYAAANAFMDALVHHRSHLGLPSLSINWGPWALAGMAAKLDKSNQRRIADLGLKPIEPQQGLQVLALLGQQDIVQVGVVPIDWPTFIKQFPLGANRALISELVHQVRTQENDQLPARPLILRQLAESNSGDHYSLLIAYLQEQVAKALGLDALLDVHKPLNDTGLDSLMALELKNRIKTDLEVDVPIVKFLEGFSVANLATQVLQELTQAKSIVATNSGRLIEPTTQIGMNQKVHPEDPGQLSQTINDSDWIEGEL